MSSDCPDSSDLPSAYDKALTRASNSTGSSLGTALIESATREELIAMVVERGVRIAELERELKEATYEVERLRTKSDQHGRMHLHAGARAR